MLVTELPFRGDMQCVTPHLVHATMSKQYQFKLVLLGRFLLFEHFFLLTLLKVNQPSESPGTSPPILLVTELILQQPCPSFREGPI